MKWTVIYRPDAADDLVDIWVDAPDRQAIADAANHIDTLLGIDPLSAGESREVNSRVVCDGPLTVFFDVNVDDRMVIVWHVVTSG